MRNSIVLSIALSLLVIVQADYLDPHGRLHERKIGDVLPRNKDENEKQTEKAGKPQFDDEELAAFAGVGTLDTGEPCDHKTTVVVTETPTRKSAAVETGSSNNRNETGNGGQKKDQNQNNNGNEKGGNKTADSAKGSDGGRGQGYHDGQNSQGKGRGEVEFLTLSINGNHNDNGRENDKTITITKTEMIDHGNGMERLVTQLSFVTKTMFDNGNAPTVTVTSMAEVITQLITVTEHGEGAGNVVTVTMNAPPVTVTEHAMAAAAAPPSTVTVTEAGICTTTDGLDGAPPATVAQNTVDSAPSQVTVQAAPSPTSSDISNGVGIINAAGFCDCQCLCNAEAFPGPSVQFAIPGIGAAQASPVTTLQTVVSFAAQAGSTALFAPSNDEGVSQAGAVDANSPVSSIEPLPTTLAAVGTAPSDSVPSQVTPEAPSVLTSVTSAAGDSTSALSSQSTDTPTVDSTTQSIADTTVADTSQPILSGSAGSVFAENPQALTTTADISVQPSTTANSDSVTTDAPSAPSALADKGGPPAPIDIKTYSLASAVALGHLRRR